MEARHKAWLAAMAAAGRGGDKAKLKDNIVRGNPWATVIRFAADYSGDAFSGAIGLEPDDGASEAADLSINVGSYSGGFTEVTLALNSTQTAALLADGDGDGLVTLLFDLHHTPAGSGKYLIVGGWTFITGSVGNV